MPEVQLSPTAPWDRPEHVLLVRVISRGRQCLTAQSYGNVTQRGVKSRGYRASAGLIRLQLNGAGEKAGPSTSLYFLKEMISFSQLRGLQGNVRNRFAQILLLGEFTLRSILRHLIETTREAHLQIQNQGGWLGMVPPMASLLVYVGTKMQVLSVSSAPS